MTDILTSISTVYTGISKSYEHLLQRNTSTYVILVTAIFQFNFWSFSQFLFWLFSCTEKHLLSSILLDISVIRQRTGMQVSAARTEIFVPTHDNIHSYTSILLKGVVCT